jgi:hypothetical protein
MITKLSIYNLQQIYVNLHPISVLWNLSGFFFNVVYIYRIMNLKPLSPLFPWVGGKRKEMKKYIQYIPDDIDTYLEPFVGGGATFFHLNHN